MATPWLRFWPNLCKQTSLFQYLTNKRAKHGDELRLELCAHLFKNSNHLDTAL